jgi:ABC-type nitrate/sulfonate/bicarbonate transport system substrate-binding protein
LTQGKVDAAVSYVPVIQKMPDDLHVLHWFSEYYPGHPCCDLVATEQALHTRQGMIRKLLATLQSGIYDVESAAPAALSFMADYYLLSPKQTAAALEHVRYRTEITAQDKAFERKMMQAFVTKGYVKTLPADQEMYYRFQE